MASTIASARPNVGVQFAKRGRRPKFGYGLHFASECRRYELYKSDKVGGVPVKPHRWLAIVLVADERGGGRRVLSRHKTRNAAAAACIKHLRRASQVRS